MNQPILSILILTLETRKKFYDRLLAILTPQLCDEVEVLVNADNGEKSIGTKRNELLNESGGKYVCFIDDDDLITKDYIERILAAAKLEPDAIGFKKRVMVDGRFDKEAIHSIRFGKWETKQWKGKTSYLRTPNHLNPVRRDIALHHPFIEVNHGEDADYSTRIKPEIRTEVFIDRALYVYEYRTNVKRKGEKTNATRKK